MRLIVADDELPARRLLVRMLATMQDVEVVGHADTGLAVLEAIGRTQPDLVLLDIEMPEMDGLELAARYARLPPFVFVTAYEEHALRAFEVGAVDYLLKPVQPERLAVALDRARQRVVPGAAGLRELDLRVSASSPRVVTHDRGTVRVFDARKINRFQAADKYTIFTADGKEHATEESLASLETRLHTFGFLRVHRSELVRVAAIRALTSEHGAHELHLEDGNYVRVSRRLLGALKDALGIRQSRTDRPVD